MNGNHYKSPAFVAMNIFTGAIRHEPGNLLTSCRNPVQLPRYSEALSLFLPHMRDVNKCICMRVRSLDLVLAQQELQFHGVF